VVETSVTASLTLIGYELNCTASPCSTIAHQRPDVAKTLRSFLRRSGRRIRSWPIPWRLMPTAAQRFSATSTVFPCHSRTSCNTPRFLEADRIYATKTSHMATAVPSTKVSGRLVD
jgi:hypothetical protein